MNLPDILTPHQIAEHQQIHVNAVYQLCVSGDIKSYKVGNRRRVRKEAYMDWLSSLENEEAQCS